MNSIIKIQGLNCPNCAKTLEHQINRLDGVKNAKIDFMKSTLSFESKNESEAFSKIVTLTKELEPDVKLILENNEKQSNTKFWIDLAVLFVGIALAVIVVATKLPPVWFWICYVSSALLLGYKTYYKAFRLLIKGSINENLLLTISVIGAGILGEFMESLMVIALYSIGKVFEGLAVEKSRKSISQLTNLAPEYATVIANGKEYQVEPTSVVVGSIIIVKPGEKVPIDGKIISGSATIDTQSLTGESLPVTLAENDTILSGSIVLDGVLEIETTCEYSGSAVSRIMNLIEHAHEKKSKTETLISKITKWYTLGVICCAILTFGIVWAITSQIDTAVYRGLIFLVVSCPCAFAISVPLSYFSGIGNASRHGILIKGSNYLDALAKLDLVAFDKTGTLTTGEFVVESVKSLKTNLSENDIIYIASLGEQNSLHPLAKSIVAKNTKELVKVKSFKEIAGEGVYFSHNKNKYFVGRKSKEQKSTMVEVFENDVKIGEIYLADQIKTTSKEAISLLEKMDVKTALLSGDNNETVEKVSNELGISECHSKLLPEDKFNWLKSQKENSKQMIGYVGDGINDSPSLTLADVGISMGIGGSPASIEASDVVLANDNPAKVASAIKISKFTNKIVWQNIIFSAITKLAFLAFGTIGLTGMLAAVFADVGVTVIAILNSMRALAYSPIKKTNRCIKENHCNKW